MQSLPVYNADPVVPILLALAALSVAGVVGGQAMRLLRQPAVLGELLMGIVVGNVAYALGNPGITVLREGQVLRKVTDLALSSNLKLSEAAVRVLPANSHSQRIADILAGSKGLDFVSVYSFVDLVSRIAILVLLFLVGLETSLGEMKRVGRSSFSVAVVGVAAPMALGLIAMKLLQPGSFWTRDLFIAGVLTATSVGITARVLRDLGQEKRDEARIILGAAVLDDVLSLIVLAVVTGLVLTGSISLASIAWTTTKSTLFLSGSILVGVWITPWFTRRLARAGLQSVKLVAGCIFAFLLAWLSNAAGLAAIVGAFAAGVILNDFFDKEMAGQSLRELLSPVESLIVPLFFVWIGIQVKLETLANRNVLIAGLALTVVGIVGKVVSGLVCPKRMNRLAVGLGMMPRGEVGLIFAGIGKSLGVVDDGLFSAVVFLVLVTTILTPPALRWRLSGSSAG
jgi:Kef-type K+ transport system membrane component KefB